MATSRSFLCAVLAGWVFLLGISPAMRHAHAGGDDTHVPLAPSNGPDSTTPFRSGPVQHSHLLVLGFEFTLPQHEADSDSVTVHIGSALGAAEDTADRPEPAGSQSDFAPLVSGPTPAAGAFVFDSHLLIGLTPPDSTLPPTALQPRSGCLRI